MYTGFFLTQPTSLQIQKFNVKQERISLFFIIIHQLGCIIAVYFISILLSILRLEQLNGFEQRSIAEQLYIVCFVLWRYVKDKGFKLTHNIFNN